MHGGINSQTTSYVETRIEGYVWNREERKAESRPGYETDNNCS